LHRDYKRDIPRTKKADVAEHPLVFDHVGLLVNEPPGTAELLSIKSSDDLRSRAAPTTHDFMARNGQKQIWLLPWCSDVT
jgi:hypothetical protein